MIRVPRSRIASLAASASAIMLTAVLGTGCGTQSDPQTPAGKGTTAPGKSKASPPAQRVLNTPLLEATLPNQFSIPTDLDQSRTRKAWDNFDATHCQSEGWPDEWCSEALTIGLAAFTNLDDQELAIRLISFSDSATAARFFIGEGTVDEVGENPPGDQIDVYEIDQPDEVAAWNGKGLYVRQGAVVAKIEYTWEPGTDIPSDRLRSLADMVVQRIKQAQAGKPPTASAR
ncbi:hypothetical protein OG883_41785 [Streptomyces sp. NBC_01142]|uniref:hypothetical protein n=1 Tax=Streptomyces sp. NBC_01142 TaxID=2975865 RepID=UPI00225A4748|nr:hypothetical protein [Streptomyces sp. NBC_01142]MCX4826201.1 hypothetical protein [Streptomyces sp. NBC_01142]